MTDGKKLTTAAGAPVPDNQNTMTARPRGPVLLQGVWLLEKLAHFDREVIPKRRMPNATSVASRLNFIPRKVIGIWLATIHRCFSCAIH